MFLTKRRTALSAASLFSGKIPAALFRSAVSADLVHRPFKHNNVIFRSFKTPLIIHMIACDKVTADRWLILNVIHVFYFRAHGVRNTDEQRNHNALVESNTHKQTREK
jgi:hypothetical protein